MYKLIALFCLFAAANAGVISSGYGLGDAGYGGLGGYGGQSVAVAAPVAVAHAAPAATSYQNFVQDSKTVGVAVTPVAVKTIAAAPAVSISQGGYGGYSSGYSSGYNSGYGSEGLSSYSLGGYGSYH